MTVLLVNGSPHEHGCTDAALKHAASVLEEQGVHTEIFWIGSKPISGCIGCGACQNACPRACIRMDGGHAVIDPVTCICCGNCKKVCPVGAITAGEM